MQRIEETLNAHKNSHTNFIVHVSNLDEIRGLAKVLEKYQFRNQFNLSIGLSEWMCGVAKAESYNTHFLIINCGNDQYVAWKPSFVHWQHGDENIIEYNAPTDDTQEDQAVNAEEPIYVPKYSVMVQLTNGGTRGLLISAENKRQMMDKLLKRLAETDIESVEAIHIGFVYMDEDVIS